MKKKTASYWLFLLPSLLGVLVFYVVPFGYSLYYALIDNMGSQEFVGLKNFSDTLTNSPWAWLWPWCCPCACRR